MHSSAAAQPNWLNVHFESTAYRLAGRTSLGTPVHLLNPALSRTLTLTLTLTLTWVCARARQQLTATLDRPLAAVHDCHEGAVRLQRHLGKVRVRVSSP